MEGQGQGLQIQPFEIKDFSGGITDFYMQGDRTRSKTLDNFLINIDKQIELRPGSDFYGASTYYLPSRRRIDKLIEFDTKYFLINQSRKLYYLNNQTWTEIQGFGGSEALENGDQYHQVSSSRWNEHVYLTSDKLSRPSKVYINDSNQFIVKTAGLPTPFIAPTYTDSILISQCILVANDLKTKFLLHMGDITIHTAADTNEITALSGTPDATNESSLYTLINILCGVYIVHAGSLDASVDLGIHKSITYYLSGGVSPTLATPPKGPYEYVKNKRVPTSAAEARDTLNELLKKYKWHVLGLFTHDASNVYANIALHFPFYSTIDPSGLDQNPTFTADYTDAIRYVNYLKNAYNLHISDGVSGADWNSSTTFSRYHTQKLNSNNYTLCTLPDATDMDSAILIIYWIWCLYGVMHINDSVKNPIHTAFQFTTTNGSADISSATLPSVGDWVFVTTDIFNDSDSNNKQAAYVTAVSGSGPYTITLSKTCNASTTITYAEFGKGFYHGSFSIGQPTSSSVTQSTEGEQIDVPTTDGLKTLLQLPQSNQAWLEVAKTIFQALSNHTRNTYTHNISSTIVNFLSGNGSFYYPVLSSYSYALVYNDTYKTSSKVERITRSGVLTTDIVETGAILGSGITQTTGVDEIDNPDFTKVINTSFPGGINTYFDFPSAFSTKPILPSAVLISGIPSLLNTTKTSYDTSNIKIELYRTVNNGTTYYLVKSINNGTTTYSDSTLDSTGSDPLDTKQTIYTTGGFVENTQPLPCKFMHILNGFAFYGYVQDGEQILKNRFIQAVSGVIDGGPSNFSDDLDDEITGISSTRNNLIVFCKSSIYRVTSGFTDTGQGSITHEKISDKLGCVSSNSIVQTEVGLFFAGTDGFYYTDGYQVIKISIDLDITYQKFIKTDEQARRISGMYDRAKRHIWWTVQLNPTERDCTSCYIYHLDYGIKPGGSFTTASNYNHFMPSSLLYFNGEIIRGDYRGLIYKHNKIYLSDPYINDTASVPFSNSTIKSHIPFDYTTCAVDFGSSYQGQWVTKIHLSAQNFGNLSLQINSIVENRYNNLDKRPIAPIRYTDNTRWGDATMIWKSDDCIWEYSGSIDYKRRFPAGTLRSQLRQIQMVPAYVGVYRYDDFPEFSFINTAPGATGTGTATILTPSGYTAILFPKDIINMYIAFDSDDYVTEYLISSFNSSSQIVFISDTPPTLSNAKWVIRGYQKEQGFSIMSYVLHFSELGFRGRTYSGKADRGENG